MCAPLKATKADQDVHHFICYNWQSWVINESTLLIMSVRPEWVSQWVSVEQNCHLSFTHFDHFLWKPEEYGGQVLKSKPAGATKPRSYSVFNVVCKLMFYYWVRWWQESLCCVHFRSCPYNFKKTVKLHKTKVYTHFQHYLADSN